MTLDQVCQPWGEHMTRFWVLISLLQYNKHTGGMLREVRVEKVLLLVATRPAVRGSRLAASSGKYFRPAEAREPVCTGYGVNRAWADGE